MTTWIEIHFYWRFFVIIANTLFTIYHTIEVLKYYDLQEDLGLVLWNCCHLFKIHRDKKNCDSIVVAFTMNMISVRTYIHTDEF